MAKWNSQDTEAGKFMGPTGVAVDTVGGITFLYVCDETGGRIIKFNAATGVRVAAFGSVGTGDGQFNRPYGIAIDPVTHDLYVSERGNDRVQRVTNTGAFVMKWGVPGGIGSVQGSFNHPIGIATDATGNVYVADHWNHRVQKFSVRFANGAWVVDNVAVWGTQGGGNGQLSGPYGLALDAAGNVWVADGFNARVQKFSPAGVYLQTVGTRGAGDGQFIVPTWVAFDTAGAMYVTSTNSDPERATAPDIEVQRIQKFTAGGAFVWRYGTYGAGDGQFQLPFDLAIDAAGFGYVSDYYNLRIQKFDFNGTETRAAQTIDFAPLPNRLTSDGPIALVASATSALPVTFTLVSGPAQLNGNVLALTGGPGVVTVRASQAGNATFRPAADVVRSFQVTNSGAGARIYFGTMGTNAVAIAIPATGNEGIFLAWVGGNEALMVKFRVNADGTLAGSSTSTVGVSGGSAAAARVRTLNGRVLGSSLVGDIAELGATFSADLQSAAGATSAIAGAYTASALGSAFHDFHFVVSAAGQMRVLEANGTAAGWGSGAVDAGGAFAVSLSATSSVTGAIDASGGVGGTVRSGSASVAFAGIGVAVLRTDRLANVSSRMRVTGGDASHAFIAGFVIAGNSPKPVLVRAIGPGLTGYGVAGAMPNPRVVVRDDRGRIVAENEDWGGVVAVADATNRLGAFALGNSSRDSAALAMLAPGAYTAQLLASGGDGVGLLEVYDASLSPSPAGERVVNLSTRGFVETGEGVLVAGFVVTGNAPRRLLIRGIGPALAAYQVPGVLADPVLKVYGENAAVIAQNDDWGSPQPISLMQQPASGADIAAANSATGAFGLASGSKDAALVVTLAPGSYSAIVSGANDTTGAAMVEVYELAAP